MDISKRICYILHDLNQWRNLYSVFMRLWEFLFVRNYIYSILLIFLVHFLLFLLLNADIFNETYEQYSGTCSLSPIWWIVKRHTFSFLFVFFTVDLGNTLLSLSHCTWEFILKQKSNFSKFNLFRKQSSDFMKTPRCFPFIYSISFL